MYSFYFRLLLFLTHRDRLLEDGGRLSDGWNEAGVRSERFGGVVMADLSETSSRTISTLGSPDYHHG